MKIEAIETTVLSVPTPTPIALEYPEHRLVVAHIHTDEGETGLGCRYYKMKIHDPDPRVNRRRVEAVKKALGDDVRLMVDVNQRLDILGNLQQARLLEDLDLVWYEEPVVEFMDWMPSDLFTSLPPCQDGHIVIPDTLGHGLTLVPGAERKYRF